MHSIFYSKNTLLTILTIVVIIFVSHKIGDVNKIKLGFFCSSQNILNSRQYSQLDMLMQKLNKFTYAIVYGGGIKDGMMGQVGKSAIRNGLSLYAIDSSQYTESQYSQAHVTMSNSLVRQENALINNVDIAIILPGNYGTLMEFFWMAFLNNVHQTNRKIIIWNIDDYYKKLIEFLESNKFQSGNNNSFRTNGIVVCDTYKEVLLNIKNI